MSKSLASKRYETKFKVTYFNYQEIEYLIKTHPALFYKIYQERKINNIYFDTYDLSSYRDNVEGERDRQKIRIRWYGKTFGTVNNPVLEIKNKRGPLGWKDRYKIDSFDLPQNGSFAYRKIINSLIKNHGNDLINLKSLRPYLLNNYEREYFLSKDNKFRITLDKNMDYFSLVPFSHQLKTFADEESTILEIKYDQIHAEDAENITQMFPNRVTKSSKYVFGIEKIVSW